VDRVLMKTLGLGLTGPVFQSRYCSSVDASSGSRRYSIAAMDDSFLIDQPAASEACPRFVAPNDRPSPRITRLPGPTHNRPILVYFEPD
jgi:hypothetical protein